MQETDIKPLADAFVERANECGIKLFPETAEELAREIFEELKNGSMIPLEVLVKEKFELDKTVKIIKGIKLTSDREDLLFYRGTQRVVVNGKERFEDNYESKNFQ